MRRALFTVALALAACVDDEGALEDPCGPAPGRICAARADGPCDPLTRLDPECDGVDWVCPAGSTARAPPGAGSPPACEVPPTAHHLGPEIPAGDRCRLLVNGDVTGGEGRRAMTVPEVPDPGACPGEIEAFDAFDRAQISEVHVVDLNDVVQTPAGRFAVHRLFVRVDADPFGVRAIGASVVRWPEGTKMPVPNPPQWAGHGFRSLAVEGDTLYLYDCFGAPEDLLEDCGVGRAPLARAEDPAAYEWAKTTGRYAPGLDDRQVVFRAGPQHSLTWHPAVERWVMTSVAGFGDTVFIATAAAPAGPWSAPRDVHRCALPEGAFCDSARLLPSLWDPETPALGALTYRIDRLGGEDPPEPAALVRVRLR